MGEPGLPASTRDSATSASPSAPTPAGARVGPTHSTAEGAAGSVSVSGVRGPHYCTVCNVSTTSAVHLQTHYMGSKHQRRLAQTHTGTDRDPSPHHCAVCGISATSAVHLQLHLSGRPHQRKAKLASEAVSEGRHHSPAALTQHIDSGTVVASIAAVPVAIFIETVQASGYESVAAFPCKRQAKSQHSVCRGLCCCLAIVSLTWCSPTSTSPH